MLTDADAAQLKRLTADLTHVTLSDVGHVIHIAATQQLISLTSGFLESLT